MIINGICENKYLMVTVRTQDNDDVIGMLTLNTDGSIASQNFWYENVLTQGTSIRNPRIVTRNSDRFIVAESGIQNGNEGLAFIRLDTSNQIPFNLVFDGALDIRKAFLLSGGVEMGVFSGSSFYALNLLTDSYNRIELGDEYQDAIAVTGGVVLAGAGLTGSEICLINLILLCHFRKFEKKP